MFVPFWMRGGPRRHWWAGPHRVHKVLQTPPICTRLYWSLVHLQGEPAMPRRLTQQELDRRRGETARVRLILDSVFNGNQTRMAEQVRASQSMISKVARGERAPGRPLLETLARLPGINSDWVLSGEGQPFPP